jgi:hypothetical protein
MHQKVPVLMERLRILAAAAALLEFRAGELCAFAGANAETVRSVLRRDTELFEVISTETNGGPGRPANRYRVKDPTRIREEIRELEQAIQPAGLETRVRPGRDTDADRLIAVATAEDAVLDSWRSDEPDERAALAQTALAALNGARRMTPEDAVQADDSLRRRTDDVEVFAQLADAEARGEPIDTDKLHRAATALSDLAEVAPERTSQFLLGLSATAVRNDQLLPLALALGQSRRPIDSISTLDADAWVEAAPLEDTGYVLWSQRWAAPLVEHRLFAGMVVQDYGAESLDAPLVHLLEWHAPTVVLSERHSPDVVRNVSESGAFLLPSSAGMYGIARTMISVFKRTAFEAAGTETISFDFGEFGRSS